MTGTVLSRDTRPELPDPESERILAQAEERVYHALQIGGAKRLVALGIMTDLTSSAAFRDAMRTVCELTPSR